jgi:hypothetical protein
VRWQVHQKRAAISDTVTLVRFVPVCVHDVFWNTFLHVVCIVVNVCVAGFIFENLRPAVGH